MLLNRCPFGQSFLEWTNSFTSDLDWLLAGRKYLPVRRIPILGPRKTNEILIQDTLSIPLNVNQMKAFTNYVHRLTCEKATSVEQAVEQATSVEEYTNSIIHYCSSQITIWSFPHIILIVFMLVH